mgnify:CR=1 FL=1
MTTWTCQKCSATGENTPPAFCPGCGCEEIFFTISEEGLDKLVEAHMILERHVTAIAEHFALNMEKWELDRPHLRIEHRIDDLDSSYVRERVFPLWYLILSGEKLQKAAAEEAAEREEKRRKEELKTLHYRRNYLIERQKAAALGLELKEVEKKISDLENLLEKK